MARSRRSSAQPRIKNLRWGGNTHTFQALSAGTAAQTLITSADATDTLMRIRGELVCWIDGLEVSATAVDIAIGAIVMPEGQGATVVSDPASDDSAPWLFYERFVVGYEEYVTDVIDASGLSVFRKTIDVKAMRILRPDREVQLVFSNTTLIGAASVNLVMSFRALLGQH